MKKLTLFLILVFPALVLWSQSPACCEKSEAPAKFASFGEQEAFRAEHPGVKEFDGSALRGKMVDFTYEGGEAKAYFIAGPENCQKAIVVIHEWWGLNEHIKQESDRLFQALGENMHVIALDMYGGKTATNPDGASQLMQNVDPEEARSIIRGAANFLPEGTEIGTIGWCFGGGWSLQAAIELGDQVKAAVIYYGMPENNIDRLEMLEAPVLGLFAGEDGWITPEVVLQFDDDMEQAGKELTYKIFDGAQHAFANPSREIYNPTAARKANEMAIEFLQENLGDE